MLRLIPEQNRGAAMSSKRESWKLGGFFSKNTQAIALLLLIVVISVLVQIRTEGRFFSGSNINDLLRETAILMMASISMMIVILTGGIDLSVGSVMGLSGMLCALVLRDYRDTPVWALFLLAVGIGLICGIFTGFIVAKLRIFPLIATLGACDVFRGLVYVFSKGVWVGQGDMTQEFLAISTGSVLGVNNLVFIALLIIVCGSIFLGYTKLGRRMYAVGNNEISSRISGINTERTKWIAYVISGVVAGLAGMLWICKFGNAQGESATGFELNVIASVVLGGVSIKGGAGKVYGVVLGAILFGILNNILPLIQVSSFWQQAIRGLVIIISMVNNAVAQRNTEKKALQRRSQNAAN